MENSKTGQMAGFLIRNWQPNLMNSFITEHTSTLQGIDYMAKSLISEHKILRLMMNIGPAADTQARLCKNFANEPVRAVYLPRWCVVDMLVRLQNNSEPVSLTFLQIAERGAEGAAPKAKQEMFIQYKKINSSEGKDSAAFWNELRIAYGRIGAAEFWSRMTGSIRPSWGVLSDGRDGALYLPQDDMHYCMTAENRKLFPDFLDDFDIGRVEKLLELSGLPTGEFLKENITKEYITEFVRKLNHQTDAELPDSEETSESAKLDL